MRFDRVPDIFRRDMPVKGQLLQMLRLLRFDADAQAVRHAHEVVEDADDVDDVDHVLIAPTGRPKIVDIILRDAGRVQR